MQLFSFSKKGNRTANEDFVLSKTWNELTSIHIVADGMGGYEHGELAAKTVANTIAEYIHEHIHINNDLEDIIKKAINHSNQAIQALRAEYNSKMGATLAGILIHKHKTYCFWVGDVRIYQIRENRIIFQSKDHTLINELLNKGQTLTPSEIQQYRHIVSKSIQGNHEELSPEIVTINDLPEPGSFIICSDGVYSSFKNDDWEQLFKMQTNPSQILSVVKNICSTKSEDNYSMVLIQC
jgi:serine/threonine protein phosphatase PrpC